MGGEGMNEREGRAVRKWEDGEGDQGRSERVYVERMGGGGRWREEVVKSEREIDRERKRVALPAMPAKI